MNLTCVMLLENHSVIIIVNVTTVKGHSQVRKQTDFNSQPTCIIYITLYSNRGMQVVIIKVNGKAHCNCAKRGGGHLRRLKTKIKTAKRIWCVWTSCWTVHHVMFSVKSRPSNMLNLSIWRTKKENRSRSKYNQMASQGLFWFNCGCLI